MPLASCLLPLLISFSFSNSHHMPNTYMSLQFPTSPHLHTIKLITSLSNVSLFSKTLSPPSQLSLSFTSNSLFLLKLQTFSPFSRTQSLLDVYWCCRSPPNGMTSSLVWIGVRNEGRQKVWLAWGEEKKHFVCNFVLVRYPLTGQNPVYITVKVLTR